MASIAAANTVEKFPTSSNELARIFHQVKLLMKLYWQEKWGNRKMSALEFIFPAYPVLMFYILVSLDIFPYEFFNLNNVSDFKAVDVGAAILSPFLPLGFNIPDPSTLAFGPSNHPQFDTMLELTCLGLGYFNDDFTGVNEELCNGVRKLETEEEIIDERAKGIIAGVFFEGTDVEINGFTLHHQSYTTLQIQMSARLEELSGLFGGGATEPPTNDEDPILSIDRLPVASELLQQFGIVQLQKAVNDALLASKGVSANVILSGKKLPDEKGVQTANFLSFFFPFLFVGSLFFNLRGMLLGMGNQVESGVREAFELKGMSRRAMWIAAMINHFSSTAITALIVAGLLFATQFYQFVTFKFIILDFILFGLAQTAFGVLVLVVAGDNVTGKKIFVYALILFILMQMLYIVFISVLLPNGASEEAITGMFVFYIIPMAHILSISTEAELRAVDLDNVGDIDTGVDLKIAYGMLLLDAIIFFAAGFLLDEVIQYRKRKAVERSAQMIEAEAEKKDEDRSEYGIIIENLRKEFKVPDPDNKSKCRTPKKILHAIDGLSLKVKKNEIFCLLGHNGAGKTTTFNCLVGSVLPTSGDAWVNGYHISRDRELLRQNIGVCPQQDIAIPNVKAIDQLVFQAMLFGRTREQAVAEAEDLLEKLDLGFKKNEYAGNLSGGQRRRLTLLLALIGSPKIIVLDEPTTGLDPNNRRKIWKLLQELKKSHTILMTTHSLEEADALADTIAIMSDGKLKEMGTSLSLKSEFGSGYRLTCLKNRGVLAEQTEHEQEVAAKSLLETVNSYVAGATIVSNAGAEIAFGLRTDQIEKFSSLFEYLEKSGQKEHNLTSFGLSPTTLEDVFLNLDVSEKDADEKSGENEKEDAVVAHDAAQDIAEIESKPCQQSTFKQLKALIIALFTSMTRTPATYVFLISHPVIFTIIFSVVSRALAPADPVGIPLEFDVEDESFVAFPVTLESGVSSDSASLFFDDVLVTSSPTTAPSKFPSQAPSDFPTIAPSAFPTIAPSKFPSSFPTPSPSKFPTTFPSTSPSNFPTTALPTLAPSDLPTGVPTSAADTRAVIFAARPTNSLFDVVDEDIYATLGANRSANEVFGGIIVHALDISADGNFFVNSTLIYEQTHDTSLLFLLQAVYDRVFELIEPTVGVQIREFPESISLAVDDVPEVTLISFPDLTSQTDFTGGGASYIIAVSLGLQSASFTVEMLNLRRKGVKEMLLLSGMSQFLFWVANLLSHLVIVLIPGFVVFFVLLAFGEGGASDTSFLFFFVLFIAFGIPTVLFGYILSFLFNDPEAAPQFSAESANILLLIPFLLTTFVFDPASSFVPAFKNLFTVISPGFGIFRGLGLFATRSTNKAPLQLNEFFTWESEYIQIILFLVVSALVYGTILIAVDMNIIKLIKARRSQKRLLLAEAEEKKNKVKKGDENKSLAEVSFADMGAENLRHVHEGTLPDPVSAIPSHENEENLRILCKHVNKRFVLTDGSIFHAVSDASLGVRRNEIFGLLGPNGAGKTTLIRCITGLNGYVMDQGIATICGFSNVSESAKVRPLMGICPQFDALLDTLTGRELLRIFARVRGVPNEDIETIVQNYLDLLGVTPKADAVAKDLSGGNKRRLSVALSMIGSPRAIFLDEPSTGLDPTTRRKLWKFLQEKASAKLEDIEGASVEEGRPAKKEGRAILLTTHSMEEADALCSNIAIMVESSVRTVGTSQELKNRYGAGFIVIFSVEEKFDRELLKSLLSELNSQTVLVDDSYTTVRFFIPKSDTKEVTWAKVFSTVLAGQKEFGYKDFSVSQRTLEDVFVEFANLQKGGDDE